VLRVILAALVTIATLWQPAPAVQSRPDLTDPSKFTGQAPVTFDAKFETTRGPFIVQVTRAWAPHGADRFYNLVRAGFYDGCRFFRVIKDALVQWGIHGDPAVTAAWNQALLPVDRAIMSNTKGRVTFAMGASPDTRTTQIFVNMRDNTRLDPDGFAPFGQVITSLVPLQQLFDKYGEGIDQTRIQLEGHAFLIRYAPELDYVKSAVILK
jgi:peptidyl-prolyl cis-trans isomerase A (cyclophilin A)